MIFCGIYILGFEHEQYVNAHTERMLTKSMIFCTFTCSRNQFLDHAGIEVSFNKDSELIAALKWSPELKTTALLVQPSLNPQAG